MKRGLQTKLANKAGLSFGYFSMLINGHRRPSWKVAKTLSKITHTQPELWLDGTPQTIRQVLSSLKL